MQIGQNKIGEFMNKQPKEKKVECNRISSQRKNI